MATFGTVQGAADFRTFDLSGTFSDQGGISFFIRQQGHSSFYFEGKNFTFAGGQPIGGVATRIEKYLGSDADIWLWSFADVSVSVADVGAAAVTRRLSDDRAVLADALHGNDTVLGRGGADYLLGFDGDDRVSGFQGDDVVGGGRGNDGLWGGRGADGFLFAESGRANVDTLEDFTAGTDWIGLVRSAFPAIGGKLGKNEFQIGKADDPNDFIIFVPGDESRNSVVRYDPDGDGEAGAVLVARMVGKTLAYTDFHMLTA